MFLKAISNSPATKGVIGALIVQLTPLSEQITSFLWIPSKIIITLALVIVGMHLGWLGTAPLSTIKYQIKSIQYSLIMKLIGLPALMLGLCLILNLPTLMKSALVLQAATPTAISVFLLAKVNYQDEDKATWLVVFTTLSALITIPLWSLAI